MRWVCAAAERTGQLRSPLVVYTEAGLPISPWGRPSLCFQEASASTLVVLYGPKSELGSVFPLSHRSEEHTSELQSLMRRSYAVFCLKKKKKKNITYKQNKRLKQHKRPLTHTLTRHTFANNTYSRYT